MDYNYSQKDSRWANQTLGKTNLKMKDFGCVITGCAMILSYYLDRIVLPSEFLKYVNDHDGIINVGEKIGSLKWEMVSKFVNNNLRFSYTPNPKEGELTFGIRHIVLGRYNHWVIDHPQKEGLVIDPLSGKEFAYREYTYLNENRFFMGKPIAPDVYPVDNRYGIKRTWNMYMLERLYRFYWIPNTPASYIYGKIKRPITDRETNGLVYGRHPYRNVFENAVGDKWLHMTENELIFGPQAK